MFAGRGTRTTGETTETGMVTSEPADTVTGDGRTDVVKREKVILVGLSI